MSAHRTRMLQTMAIVWRDFRFRGYGACQFAGERCPEVGVPGFDAQYYSLTTFSAWRPLGPLVTPNSTVSPSFRDLKPEAWMAE